MKILLLILSITSKIVKKQNKHIRYLKETGENIKDNPGQAILKPIELL